MPLAEPGDLGPLRQAFSKAQWSPYHWKAGLPDVHLHSVIFIMCSAMLLREVVRKVILLRRLALCSPAGSVRPQLGSPAGSVRPRLGSPAGSVRPRLGSSAEQAAVWFARGSVRPQLGSPTSLVCSKRTVGRTVGRTDGQLDGRTLNPKRADGRTVGRTDPKQTDGRTDLDPNGPTDGRADRPQTLNGRTDGRTVRRIVERTDTRTDGP